MAKRPPRSGKADSVGTAEDLPSAISAEALRAGWRRTIGKPMPRHLPQMLLMRVLAYRQQALRHGDLSRQALAELKRAAARTGRDEGNGGSPPSAPRILKPGTLLVREHGGAMHQVMVMANGFAWRGKTYPSLSGVAFAITGTRWNGPRFFGLDRRGRL
ncbi:DUF2924 domain-containing protein [Bosea sp. (in: a-proteobacteria)]|uniref:DUF2924 domain-containing protein n=1 Tax=Bosea sp. (in: a-proteobacteria) TaxID=1871050 RepID=UPI00260DE5F5|nr:DUF2924 domain-containing protein [Bosea sp. (in: a-proteobacteria)]MCO5093600.1 DUF2924 domain-containing protein [Bosea sp. (in: a-proteobacteria)]